MGVLQPMHFLLLAAILVMVLFWVGVILGLVMLVRRLARPTAPPPPPVTLPPR